MKKGLSVLLIAAALFGFYGGATNLNDVLACKDYFESASGASDDMQRLEDGLNQLKDNEQAYLDGQVALAEGEKTLADGYATLADGEKQYADGLAAYKAAPGKLADGKEGLKKLRKAIAGINALKAADGYPKWKKNYDDMKDARNQFYAGTKGMKDSLLALAAFLPEANQKAYAAAVEDVAGDDGKQTYKDYNEYIKSTNVLASAIPAIQTGVQTSKGNAETLKGLAQNPGTSHPDAGTYGVAFANQCATKGAAVKNLAKLAAAAAKEKGLPYDAKAFTDAVDDVAATFAANAAGLKSDDPATKGAAAQAVTKKVMDYASVWKIDYSGNDIGTFGLAVGYLDGILATLNSDKVQNELIPGLEKFNKATAPNDEGKNGAKQLLEGQDDSVADGVRQLVSGILGDKTMKNNLIKKVGKAKVNAMKKYGKKSSPLYSKNSDFAEFEKKMDSNPGVMDFLKKALPVVKARLAAGEKEYAAGVKSYKEAPAKLADARKQLADGRAQLADGEKQLADGKAQLAQYEDGEQQVRDGLATLVGTQPMGDVQGIADRIGNDTDFDNGDEHLELDEGLSAVQAGKGYASDLTAAVTDEIMSRAIATGLLIGAGVLAVLAALLSFLKKNKGAGVFAILAAAAGCVGAFMGNAAGMQFSSIAGSTMGATPWVAAGILAAVAAVHAIVHFTAKKEA